MRIYFSHPHPRRKKDCIPSTILQKQLLIHAENEENIIYYSLPMRARKYQRAKNDITHNFFTIRFWGNEHERSSSKRT